MRNLYAFLFLAFPLLSFAQEPSVRFTAQPEVVSIWKDSVAIQWSTSTPSLGIVCLNDHPCLFGRDGNNDGFDGTFTTRHRFTVKNLQPGHIYKVRICAVGSDTSWSSEKYIATQSSSTGKFTIYFTSPVDTTVSTGVNATYLNNVVDDTLVEYINRTQISLDIAIYNTTSSTSVADIAAAINAAYARGVRVRVIYDGSTGNSMIPNLNPGINRVASPQGSPYNIMHNKFVVMDADANNPNLPYVWTGSTNWTTSQVNGTDKNNVIIVQDQSLAGAYKLEFEEMWGDTGLVPNPNTARFGPFKLDNTPHLFNIGGVVVESYFSPSDSVNDRLKQVISYADYDMEFASMVITRTDVADSIVSRVNAGVFNTYGLTDDSVQTTTWSILKGGMLPHTMVSHTGQAGIMHNKYLIVDQSNPGSDPILLTGSHNWSTSANTQNDENTLIIHDPAVANIYYQNFVWLFGQHGGIMGTGTVPAGNVTGAFPNPSNGDVTLRLADAGEVRLLDLAGMQVGSWKLAAGDHVLDLTGVAKGIYVLLFSAEKSTSALKLVIQ
jgi:hypothetical protein